MGSELPDPSNAPPLSTMMNGYEDVWRCIFEFSASDNFKHMSNLSNVCKHWNEIVSNWDQFLLLSFTHFLSLEGRLDTMSVCMLPELTRTRQLILERLLLTASNPKQHYYQRLIYRFTVLASTTEDQKQRELNEQYILFVLKYVPWNLDHFRLSSVMLKYPTVAKLVHNCVHVFSILDAIFDPEQLKISIDSDQLRRLRELITEFSVEYYVNAGENDMPHKINHLGKFESEHVSREMYLMMVPNLYYMEQVPLQYFQDRDFVQFVAKYSLPSLARASCDLLSDRSFILELMNQVNGSGALLYASEDLQIDKELVWKGIRDEPSCFEKLGAICDRNLIMQAMKINPSILEYVPQQYWLDDELVLEAVKLKGSLLRFVESDLRNNRQVILNAVRNCPSAINYASQELQNDREIIYTAISSCNDQIFLGHVLQKLSEQDVDVALMAVSKNGYNLQYLPTKLRNDKLVVMEAVRNDGNVLEYASVQLRNDDQVVWEALNSSRPSMTCTLMYASERLRSNHTIVMKAVEQHGGNLQYASKALQNDKEIVMAATTNCGSALQFASLSLQNNEQVLLNAGPGALQFATNDIRRYKRVLLQVLKRDGAALQFVSDQKSLDDRQVVLQAVTSDGCALRYASDRLKDDEEIVLQALEQNPDSLQFVADCWRSNRRVVLDVVKRKPSVIPFVSDQLKRDEELVRLAADYGYFCF